METKYDIIVNFFLNNWYFAIIVIVCVIIIAIPQIREGIKMLYDILRSTFKKLKKKDVFIYEKNGERGVLTRILNSKQLDVIKVDTQSHDIGIQSEYAWLKKFYPKFKHPMQHLSMLETEQGEKVFDMFPITNGETSKKIYFDITSFFKEPIEILMNENERTMYKIQKLYRKIKVDE